MTLWVTVVYNVSDACWARECSGNPSRSSNSGGNDIEDIYIEDSATSIYAVERAGEAP